MRKIKESMALYRDNEKDIIKDVADLVKEGWVKTQTFGKVVPVPGDEEMFMQELVKYEDGGKE